MTNLTRLEVLCAIHGMQGGTIFMFNEAYKRDFILMSDEEFREFCLRGPRVYGIRSAR